MAQKTREAFAAPGAQIAAMDQRFVSRDQRLVSRDQRFVSRDQRFVSMDRRFQSIDQRFASMDQRFDSLEARLDEERRHVGVLIETVRQTSRRSPRWSWPTRKPSSSCGDGSTRLSRVG